MVGYLIHVVASHFILSLLCNADRTCTDVHLTEKGKSQSHDSGCMLSCDVIVSLYKTQLTVSFQCGCIYEYMLHAVLVGTALITIAKVFGGVHLALVLYMYTSYVNAMHA